MLAISYRKTNFTPAPGSPINVPKGSKTLAFTFDTEGNALVTMCDHNLHIIGKDYFPTRNFILQFLANGIVRPSGTGLITHFPPTNQERFDEMNEIYVQGRNIHRDSEMASWQSENNLSLDYCTSAKQSLVQLYRLYETPLEKLLLHVHLIRLSSGWLRFQMQVRYLGWRLGMAENGGFGSWLVG